MMRRIALAIPVEKTVDGDVFSQWLEIMQDGWPGPRFRFRPAYIVPARNGLTAAALLRGDWEDFLFVDSDIMPDARLLRRLWELTQHPLYLADNGGVICGAYYQREYPFEVQLYRAHTEHQGLVFIHPAQWIPIIQESKRLNDANQPGPLLEIGGGGTGLMLIRRDVLERLAELKGGADKIWEAPEIEPELLELVRAAGEDRANGHWTEDVWFCMEVKNRLGIQVYADTDFRFSGAHVGRDRVDVSNYLAAHTIPAGFENADIKLPKGYQIAQPNRAARRRADRSVVLR